MSLALASSRAKAVAAVHGSGTPSIELKIGPNWLEYSVRLSGSMVPFGWRTWTVTLREVIGTTCPS